MRSLLRLLAFIAPKARRRAPERAYKGAGDKLDRDSRFTPPEFLEHIYAAFGKIDLDLCAHTLSPVVARRRIILNEGGDGLANDWSGRLAFINPPFSALLIWLKRADCGRDHSNDPARLPFGGSFVMPQVFPPHSPYLAGGRPTRGFASSAICSMGKPPQARQR